MASYTISTAVTTAGTAQLINTGDTVTVTSSGSLDGTGAFGIGIYGGTSGGASGGHETLQVSGQVRGSQYGYEDAGTAGHDNVQVMSGGSIYGGTSAAVYIDGGSNTISNAGSIVDSAAFAAAGVKLTDGANTVTNSGSISVSGNAIYVTAGSGNTVTNSGTIGAGGWGISLGGAGHNVIGNSGTIAAGYGIGVSGVQNTVTNSGTIEANAYGIGLSGNGNTVTNLGSVSATTEGGIEMSGGANKIVNSGTLVGHFGVAVNGTDNVIHNTGAGAITGTATGIALSGPSNVIKNAGSISGASNGVAIGGGTDSHVKILHHGSVTGTANDGIVVVGSDVHVVVKGAGAITGGVAGIELQGGSNIAKISAYGTVNAGTIGLYDHAGTSDHIFNAGTIAGGAHGVGIQAGGQVHLHNSGTIAGGSDTGLYINGDSNHVTNQGRIVGAGLGAYFGSGSNVVVNKSGGLIKGIVHSSGGGFGGIYFGSGGDTVTNDGKMVVALHGYTGHAVISAASGSNTIVNNSGGLITDFHGADTGDYAIDLNGKSNAVTNAGRIVGTVRLGGSGTNSFEGSHGRLKGTVLGASGSDTIVLGHGHSSVIGGGGADAIQAGSGPDNFIYTATGNSTDTGYDTVDGFKAGTDTFSFALSGHHALNGLASVTVGSLSSVDATSIENAVSGHLDPYGAVALSVGSGVYSGDVFLVVDANGDSTFTTGADYLVALTHLSGTLTASDILTT